jgi:hypothetical protein
MWITAIRTEGFAPQADLTLEDLPRAAFIHGPAERCEQVAAALQLFFAALLPERLPRVLVGLGFEPVPGAIEVLGQPLPDQARWSLPWAAHALLADPQARNLKIRLTMALDPLQFRFLREHAGRHPWLVAALAEGARAEITVGWLFDKDHSAAVVSVLTVVLGEEQVPVAGPESPGWLPAFLQGLARRFRALPHPGGSLPQAAEAWLEALTDPRPGRLDAATRVSASLEAPPFSLERVRPVRWGDAAAVVTGPRARPIAWSGPAAVEAVELAAAVHLSGAEILCLRYPGLQQPEPAAVQAWLAAAATEPGSPLEQVLLLGVAHDDGVILRGEEQPEA